MKWIVAYVCFIAVSVVSAVVQALIFKSLNKEIAIVSLTIGIFIAIYILLQKNQFLSGLEKKDFGFWSIISIIVFTLFSLRAFLWLVFKKGDSLNVLSPHNYGDMPSHIHFITYLASGAKFWPDSPIISGYKFLYPIGMDLFNSLLILIGLDLVRSLIWVGLLCSIVTGAALIVWGRAFTLSGFLFNGGFAGFIFFQNFVFDDYQRELAWKSIPLTLFIPQRGFLFALPAGLLLLTSWKNRFFKSNNTSIMNSDILLPTWVEVLLYSSMPLFHMHTFIYLSLLLGFWLLFFSERYQIFNFVRISFLPALFLTALLTDFFSRASMIHIHWGWEQNNQDFLRFWLLNFGIFLPLVIWLCISLFKTKKSDRATKAFTYPAIVFFVLFCNVMVSPYNWDNIKLLMWSYLILLPFIWEELIYDKHLFVKSYICFVLFFSGCISLIGGIGPKYNGFEMFNLSEIREVSSSIQGLSLKKRFACFPTFNHPLYFSGCKVVLGYPGWLWSNGYSIEGRDEKLKRFMFGDSDWQKLAKELEIRYIFWGPREQHEYIASTKPWEQSATKVASGSWGEIYDLGEFK